MVRTLFRRAAGPLANEGGYLYEIPIIAAVIVILISAVLPYLPEFLKLPAILVAAGAVVFYFLYSFRRRR
jgi:hypothetical protein